MSKNGPGVNSFAKNANYFQSIARSKKDKAKYKQCQQTIYNFANFRLEKSDLYLDPVLAARHGAVAEHGPLAPGAEG